MEGVWAAVGALVANVAAGMRLVFAITTDVGTRCVRRRERGYQLAVVSAGRVAAAQLPLGCRRYLGPTNRTQGRHHPHVAFGLAKRHRSDR